MENADDLCPRPQRSPPPATQPHAPPIYLASVYECRDPQQIDALVEGREGGYIYARDGHPNADMLAEKCRQLHGAERAAIANSGMATLALVLLSQLEPGDHAVVSNQLYGRTLGLFGGEAARLGIFTTLVDPCDLPAVAAAITPRSKLLFVETISNPLLRVADLAALAELAHSRGLTLVVDNTMAGPAICRPRDFGADLIMESITKTMNGHSDVMLGMSCGAADRWQRAPVVSTTWGLASQPFNCWLALRGLATLALRMERSCANALAAARLLAAAPAVKRVYYPGLSDHPDHALARRQFGDRYGSMVTFTLPGGAAAATRFMHAAQSIPFCPSLGELNTTLSHPESTSHRALTPAARAELGIEGGTIRLSIGIESSDSVVGAIAQGLAGVG